MGPRCGLLLVACLAGSCPAGGIRACNVPVFRYALERWQPDLYEAILFHDGPMTSELEQLATMLRATDDHGRPTVNLRLTTVDLDGELDEAARALWEQHPRAAAPWLVVRYPSSLRLDKTVWSGPAHRTAVTALLNSPARRELGRRLLAGHSNVWVVIESGDADRDRRVVETIDRELKKLSATIKLPDESAQAGGLLKLPEDQGEGVLSKVPLQIEFSVIRMSRSDAAERVFLANILQTDEGLAADTGVIVLPVFGRGRALQAFPGLELDAGTIAAVEEFLCGACSCSVKAQNPGMDLLLAVNWEEALQNEPRAAESRPEESNEPAAPTLVAIPAGHTSSDSMTGMVSAHRSSSDATGSGLSRNSMLIALAVACAVAVLAGVLTLRGKK